MNPPQHPAATTSPKLHRSDSRFLSISLLTVTAIERKSIWKERMNEYERKGFLGVGFVLLCFDFFIRKSAEVININCIILYMKIYV
uniref:Uncharacterized protein n=1 Tax=Cannabis sativa TaxID=3483 RepID=A0A803R7Y0_CANSA